MTRTGRETGNSSGFAPVLTRAAEAETTRDPTKASELFHVIDGALQVLVGEEITLTPGAGRFDCLWLLGRVMRGEADPQEIKHSSERFDIHHDDSPVWREALAARP